MIITVYPENWFGRSAKGKRHAAIYDGSFDKHGNPVTDDGKRRTVVTALCGVIGQPSGNEFKDTEGSYTACSRCAKKIATMEQS